MKLWQGILLGVVFGLLVGGVIILVISPARGNPVELQPIPTPSPMKVYVAGSVISPGVYSLPVTSRVSDAIQAAGGLRPEADANLLNLASLVHDGDRLWVPAKVVETPTSGSGISGMVCITTTPIPPSPEHPLNINTASVDQIDLLPGIGPVKAGQIVAYRNQNGPFTAIDELLNVPGITASIYEKIKDLITVSTQP
jgi:competence protein ComEA